MMKGMIALTLVLAVALIVSPAAWGQTTTSYWDDTDETDTGRRDARAVRDQAYGSLIDIIRLLTGPENWGEVRVVTGYRETEDEYTTGW